jgi:hypothetical protein
MLAMCEREARDDAGRFRPGASGNVAGKPVRKPFARLLAAAEAVGADVVVMVPPRVRGRGRVAIDDDPLPPATA